MGRLVTEGQSRRTKSHQTWLGERLAEVDQWQLKKGLSLGKDTGVTLRKSPRGLKKWVQGFPLGYSFGRKFSSGVQ